MSSNEKPIYLLMIGKKQLIGNKVTVLYVVAKLIEGNT